MCPTFRCSVSASAPAVGTWPARLPRIARFQGFAAVAAYFSEVTDRSIESASQAIARARAAEARWKETGIAETIPAVAAEGGDVAMPLREAYEYYGTSRGAVANYVNAFAVQSRAYTATFDSLSTAARITVPTLIVHSEHALAPDLARRFFGGLTVSARRGVAGIAGPDRFL